MRSQDYRYVETSFFNHTIHTFSMKISDLLKIFYVAVRGKSSEEGAVQRVLNKRRISQIKDFILDGNLFVNTFILNWTESDNLPKIKKDTLNIPLDGRYAQVLDGQHRIMGLREAVNVDSQIGEQKVLVSLCVGLTTPDAAKIFLNINSEQKPVPKSLIYDLFGEAVDDKEHAINRTTDIIKFLNENELSPFYQMVKYPGSPRASGLIDLAIMVNAMKGHFGKDGDFVRLRLGEIEVQQKIILNFFEALRQIYQEEKLWYKKTENPFIKAAGFNGAFTFLTEVLVPKCQSDRDFTVGHMKKLMKLKSENLLTVKDLKNLDGKSARKAVKSFFDNAFLQDVPTSSDDYEF